MKNEKEQVKFPFVCFYNDRTPNPGRCTIIEINYETRRLEISNGSVRLFPNFDEVEIFRIRKHGLKKVNWL